MIDIRAYRGTVVFCDAQLEFAVQVDFTGGPSELEHVKGEVVGSSNSIFIHPHRIVSRVRTAAHRQETHSTADQIKMHIYY